MCDVCDGSGLFHGRVEHMRLVTPELCLTSATYATEQLCWVEGTYIRCPTCKPEMYGRVTRITKRK